MYWSNCLPSAPLNSKYQERIDPRIISKYNLKYHERFNPRNSNKERRKNTTFPIIIFATKSSHPKITISLAIGTIFSNKCLTRTIIYISLIITALLVLSANTSDISADRRLTVSTLPPTLSSPERTLERSQITYYSWRLIPLQLWLDYTLWAKCMSPVHVPY